MSIKDRLTKFTKTFKLDSHHAIERFGLFFGVLSLTGLLVLTTSGASAFVAGREQMADTALWTQTFTTSKTQLKGNVDGVYTNQLKNKTLVMMHFDDRAKISYNAVDYQAFLLGSNEQLKSEKLATPGVTGSFHVFGSTGYVGVLLEAKQPFEPQVWNLTLRAKAELTFSQQQASGASNEDVVGDASFAKFDQWRVFINPGATGTKPLATLDAANFNPARAFYEIALKGKEDAARTALDTKLAEMRTNLTQISSYTDDLATTKVDGLFLRPPTVPTIVAGDEITGHNASETTDKTSMLALNTKSVVRGGFNFDWRSGNVYDGYLDGIVPKGHSYIEFLQAKAAETQGTDTSASNGISEIQWTLSNGKSLTQDYRTSDVTMRPLTTAMNNLSQAYQDYATNKAQYQGTLLLELLKLDVDLKDVRSNSTTNNGEGFLTTYR